MHSEAALIVVGFVAFAFTNLDDLFVLAAFFADPHLARRSVVIGQFAGIGALTIASVAAAWLAVAVPAGWIALLGLVPLLMGIARLIGLRRDGAQEGGDHEAERIRASEHVAERRLHSQALAVAAMTIANGGDNLAVYVPLFASAPSEALVYVAVFAVMTGLWCVAAYLLVSNRVAGHVVRRFGRVAFPFVLIGLGLYILAGAAALFR
jgi:cadmium resistance protein CadD (predicted permease)